MKKLLLFLFCISIAAVKAQNGFTTYTTNLGISGSIKYQTAFVVDNTGNKWIGFKTVPVSSPNAGLVKYNGSTWTVYNATTTPAFSAATINALAADASGNIWIGTATGLVKFDGTSFTTFTSANGLPSNTITCVASVGSQIYAGTNSGLSRYDGTSFTNYNVAGSTLPNDTITCIKAETANLLWLGGKNRMTEFAITGSFVSSYVNHAISGNPGIINCVYIDSQNDKWLGTTNAGILKYSGSSFVNASSLYQIFGSQIPVKVFDITAGFHPGSIMFKHVNSISTSGSYSGLTELAPGNKVYQYYHPTKGFVLGDLLEYDGTSLLISQGSPAIGYSNTLSNMFFRFDMTNYKTQIGIISNDNFKTLDINNVRAGIANRSDMHWDIGGTGNAMYEAPKGSGKNSNFASALWIGGLDAGGQLHGGAQTYRQGGVDFWPGPLDTINATIDTATCRNYDKIWKVSYTDINTFITAYNSGSVVATEDMMTWPAHGTGNNSRNLAPFVDSNGDGFYNPNDGDYPKIKGDQALYFIYNDKLATHSTSYTPMGIEVQGMAYAYGCPAVVNGHNELTYTTFYDYKIINRSSSSYHDVFVGMWSDADLGQYADDYIGCNVPDNYGYIYNGDSNDDTGFGVQGYGAYMPAQGFNVVKGPLANAGDGVDNNNNGVIDEPNEDCKMNKFTYFENSLPGIPAGVTDPQIAQEYYNYTTGFWKDGTPFTCGGNGYGGSVPTSFVYPSNTYTNGPCGTATWDETGVPGDRRLIVSSGPFTLNAGQMQEVEYAFVTSFDSTTANMPLLSVAKLKTDIQKVNAFYNQVNKPNCLQAISVGVTETLKQNDFALYPNPARSVITLQSTIEGPVKIDYEIVDVLGKTVIQSQNYNNSFTVSISDLNTGIYFIRLKINNSLVVKKFVKE
jgi:hypothetical protein